MSRSIHWPSGDSLAEAWGLPSVERHDVVESTQDRALALAREGAPPWTTVVAHEQTMGRGRRGRAWKSGRGLGIWMSLVMPPVLDGLDDPPMLPLTLRLGVGVADALASAVPSARVQLKWPNDVWLNGRKVAGILAERVGPHTIAGVGVNVAHASDDFDASMVDKATSLRIAGWSDEAVSLGGAIINGIRAALTRSSVDVLADLRARDALLDKQVVCPDGRVARGVGFDQDGALLVRAGDDEWRITAGTIQLKTTMDGSPAGG